MTSQSLASTERLAPATAHHDTLVVCETFLSIQGEGRRAGRPCFFVRLTGCPLRCTYCDTTYAFHQGAKRAVDDIADEALASGVELIQLTGGEPLVQPACPRLAQVLIDAGRTVLVETSGAFPIDTLPPKAIRVMDIKCPSSGELERNLGSNLPLLTEHDDVKFVIGDREDYLWARGVVAEKRLAERCEVIFSPVHNALPPGDLAAWILHDRLAVRLGLQLHKLIWPGVERGV